MKVKRAFMLIEVLIAAFVLLSGVYVAARLQMKSMLRVLGDRDHTQKIFLIKKDLFSVFIDPPEFVPEKPALQEHALVGLKVEMKKEKIHEKSGIEQFADRLELIKVKGSWKTGLISQDDVMLGFMPIPQDTEEKKK
ncbi:MAG: hypothetical protein H6679_03160 [Epsilonproteobacteria bacterium]|nr:hypothetical protein [Campylobacterota bacterium]